VPRRGAMSGRRAESVRSGGDQGKELRGLYLTAAVALEASVARKWKGPSRKGTALGIARM
jgi:hypothetical protein